MGAAVSKQIKTTCIKNYVYKHKKKGNLNPVYYIFRLIIPNYAYWLLFHCFIMKFTRFISSSLFKRVRSFGATPEAGNNKRRYILDPPKIKCMNYENSFCCFHVTTLFYFAEHSGNLMRKLV